MTLIRAASPFQHYARIEESEVAYALRIVGSKVKSDTTTAVDIATERTDERDMMDLPTGWRPPTSLRPAGTSGV